MPASEREVAVVGDFDADDRLRDQARDGVSAEVIFPTFALQACFASRRRRTAAEPVPGVQQLGDRGVRRSPTAPRRRRVDARHRRRDRGREAGSRAGVPRVVPARPGAAAPVQRRGVRPVLGRRRRPRPAAHVPFRYRPRAARAQRPRRRGRQLPDGRAARRPDGDAHDGGGRRARPVPRAAGRHRRDRCGVARVDHDAGRRDLRGPQHVGAPEAVAQAERADPAPVRGHVHVRPGRGQQPRRSPEWRR